MGHRTTPLQVHCLTHQRSLSPKTPNMRSLNSKRLPNMRHLVVGMEYVTYIHSFDLYQHRRSLPQGNKIAVRRQCHHDLSHQSDPKTRSSMRSLTIRHSMAGTMYVEIHCFDTC